MTCVILSAALLLLSAPASAQSCGLPPLPPLPPLGCHRLSRSTATHTGIAGGVGCPLVTVRQPTSDPRQRDDEQRPAADASHAAASPLVPYEFASTIKTRSRYSARSRPATSITCPGSDTRAIHVPSSSWSMSVSDLGPSPGVIVAASKRPGAALGPSSVCPRAEWRIPSRSTSANPRPCAWSPYMPRQV